MRLSHQACESNAKRPIRLIARKPHQWAVSFRPTVIPTPQRFAVRQIAAVQTKNMAHSTYQVSRRG